MKGYIIYDNQAGVWYNGEDNPYTAEELVGFTNWLMDRHPDKFIGLPKPTVTVAQRITACNHYDLLIVEVITY